MKLVLDYSEYELLCERFGHACKARNCPLSKENTGYDCKQYIRSNTQDAIKLIRIGLLQTTPVQTVPCCSNCTYKHTQLNNGNLEYFCMHGCVGRVEEYRRVKNGGKLTTSPNWCPKRKVNGGTGE